jgi:hypothetical protein
MQQLLPPDMALETGIRIYQNVFPLDLLCDMAHVAMSQPDRKTVYDACLDGPFPESFHQAAQILVDSGVTPAINTLIVKRYEDGEPSAAFDFHRDPEEYEDQLVLCSLGGFAILDVIDINIGGPLGIQCRANTVVTLPAYGTQKLHKISPPNLEYGVRPFAFFGHRHP